MSSATNVLSRHKWIARFRLRVVEGPDAGAAVESRGVEVTVGTAEGNHLQLTDPAVSRHHCAFTVTDDGIELRDLDSTNGTTLGGYRVTAAYAAPGARIGVGKTALAFEAMEEEYCEALSRADRYGELVGRSDEMRRVFAMCERVAASEATILIEGETGTGKGALARAIHDASERASAPFVVVDCASIPASLIESELFGHERGAFTGAEHRQIGLFESADGGTVFLDEVGELPLELQPRLLRVLESRQIHRVGAARPISVDFRLLAATNRDLRRSVNRGTFRSDLLYRLNTVRIVMPPLRERPEDIPPLVAKFYAELAGDPEASPPAAWVDAMKQGAWRGNVRELRSAVERALILDRVDVHPGPAAPDEPHPSVPLFDPEVPFQNAKTHAVADWERRYLRELMAHSRGNLTQASRLARMDRGYLRELLRRHNLAAR